MRREGTDTVLMKVKSMIGDLLRHLAALANEWSGRCIDIALGAVLLCETFGILKKNASG
jgi:hypothetical protein